MHNKIEPTNVFFVFTPLHVMIARSIIKKNAISNTLFIVFIDGSEKTKKYCERLLLNGEKIIEINIHRNLKDILSIIQLTKIRRALIKNHITVYTGSIKSLYSRVFIRNANKKISINTFDDGYGNLIKNGYLSKNDNPIKRFCLSLIGVHQTYDQTIKKIENHYTIYSSENIYAKHCKNVIDITLHNDSYDTQLKAAPNAPTMRILLTQPYSERKLCKTEEEIKIYNTAITNFNITHQLSHPLESSEKSNSIHATPITTDLVAEELALSLSKQSRVELYAFGSTALINLSKSYNIKCFWLRHDKINPTLPEKEVMQNITLVEISYP